MTNLSKTPPRSFLLGAENLLSPPPLKRRRTDVDRIAFPATACSTIPRLLRLPDLIDKNTQSQESIPRIFLKPRRPFMGVRRKSPPVSKLADVQPLSSMFEDVASVKRQRPPFSSSSARCA
jgi:hypothetical protein